jgi:phosphomannomutase/phosphoglucomutase
VSKQGSRGKHHPTKNCHVTHYLSTDTTANLSLNYLYLLTLNIDERYELTTNRRLFGTNGIRGIVNEELKPEMVTKLGLALGTYFGKCNILIGYDSRTSNDIIVKIISASLASVGTNVYNAGLAPTPALQFAVKYYNLGGAVIITASHNPPEYNGIKVVASDGVEIPREEEEKIEHVFYTEEFRRQRWDQLGRITTFPDVINTYTEAIKRHIDVNAIKKKRFHVVVDPANSVGGLVTPHLLRELGCEVTTINAELDGHFPSRLPEPKPETLSKLSIVVKALDANLGIAHDGDADRCLFVDEEGTICLGDRTGAIIIDYVLEKHSPSIVVTPISSSMLLEDIVHKRNSEIRWSTVGSTKVSREMLELQSIISIEDNGGIFYQPHQPVRDGALAAVFMLEILAKREKSLSELVASLPIYHIIKERINCPNNKKQKVLEKILGFTKNHKRITIDGVKIFFDDGTVLIRPSGTEAIYRVYAESKNGERAQVLVTWGISLVHKGLKSICSTIASDNHIAD